MHIIKASLLNICGRIVSILSTFFSVFLLGRMFSPSEFGYWAWLFSIFSLITAQDFGFIGAMRVRLGRAISSGDEPNQKLVFSVAFFLSIILSAILLGAFAIIVGANWIDSFDVLLVVGCALVTVVGYCSAQGSVAYLQSGWIGVAESVRGVLQIITIVCSQYFELGLGITLLLFYFVTALYTPFVSVVFLKSRNWHLLELLYELKADIKCGLLVGKDLLRNGVFLWLLQIGLACLSLSDVFIAGLLLEDEDVAVVNAIIRLVLVAVGFIMAAMTPLTGYFVARQTIIDKELVFNRCLIAIALLALAGLTYGLVLYYFGPLIIQYWANLTVAPSYVFVIAGLLFSAMSMVVLLQSFLQIQNFTKAMLPWLIVAAGLKLALPYAIVPFAGYPGIFLSSLAVNLLFVLVAFLSLFWLGYLEKMLATPGV